MKKVCIVISFCLATTVTAQEITPFLGFSVDGRTRMVVTDPNGDRTGNIGLEIYNESSNTELGLFSETINVTYFEPVLGNYQVDFRAQYDEQFRFRMIYLDPTGQYDEIDFTRWAQANATTTMTVTVSLDNETGSYLFSSDQFNAPVDVVATPNGSQSNISWDPVASTIGYSVYYKYNDYPYYGLLGTTTGTTMTADVPYATDSDDERFPNDLHYFTVLAHLSDGTQTVLSQSVGNDDRDGDRLRDWIEVDAYQTNPDSSDTDGDSLNDFLEINLYRTDPNDVDTDGDSYTDDDELEQDTNPLDPDSFPEQISCLQDDDGDYIVDGDCVIDTDTQIDGNITILDSALLSINNSAQLLIDLSQYFIRIIRGGTLQVEHDSSVSY